MLHFLACCWLNLFTFYFIYGSSKCPIALSLIWSLCCMPSSLDFPKLCFQVLWVSIKALSWVAYANREVDSLSLFLEMCMSAKEKTVYASNKIAGNSSGWTTENKRLLLLDFIHIHDLLSGQWVIGMTFHLGLLRWLISHVKVVHDLSKIHIYSSLIYRMSTQQYS